MPTYYFTIITFFFCHSLSAQDAFLQKMPLDSALQWLEVNVYEDTTRFHQRALATYYRARGTQVDSLAARASEILSTWHYFYGQYGNDSIVHYDQLKLDHYLAAGDSVNAAQAYRHLSTDYINFGQYDQSQTLIFASLEICEALNDQAGIAKCYGELCAVFRLMQQPAKAVDYGNQALDILFAIPDSLGSVIILFDLSKAYLDLEDFSNALETAQLAVDLIDQNFNDRTKFTQLRTYNYRGDVYKAMGNYDAARKDYEFVYQKAFEYGGQYLADGFASPLGSLEMELGNYEKALPYLLVTLDQSLQAESKADLWKQYKSVRVCYQETGDAANALKYALLEAAARDSMQTSRIANLESELEVKYQSGKKDARIEEQGKQLNQQRQNQLLILGILALVLVVLGLVYRNFRNNKKQNARLSQLNKELEAKNAENELLLKEIHHRVKNNLQVISSLLSLQSASIEDPKALGAVKESQNRVRSMALIHQKLYQGKNLAAVEMKDYLETLGKTMLNSFGVPTGKVDIELPMQELELDVDTAIPVGLIVNELLTNSLKYAFPDNQNGTIQISLEQKGPKRLQLRVEDNGVGSTTVAPSAGGTGFGSQLVNLLTIQLNGQLKKESRSGTRIVVEFDEQQAA